MTSTQMIVLAALAAAAPAYASTGSIEGSVVDETSKVVGAGRVNIDVACGKVKKSTRVDGAGHFLVGGLPAGACTLTAGGGVYASTQITLTVNAGAITTLLVNVQSKTYVEKLQRDREAMMKRPRIHGRGGGRANMPAGVAVDAPNIAPAPMAPPPRPMVQPKPDKAPAPKPVEPKVADNKKLEAAKPQAIPPVAGGKLGERRNVDRPVKLDPANRDFAKRKQAVVDVRARGPRQQHDGGWAIVRVFPVPQYTKAYDGPRTDFRETVYWNPSVETNGNGDAEVAFVASDAVTAFRATAEGFGAAGSLGAGQVTFQSKLPLTLDARLPVEVTSGDTIRLPITLANETAEAMDATLSAKFGTAFKLAAPAGGSIKLKANEKQTVFVALEVVATDGNADVEIKLAGRGLTDEIKKTIRVVPRGFPIEASASGTARGGTPSRHTVDLAGALPGTIRAKVMMYPSPVAAMAQGMEGMIREPGGCFEQTSSTNYPNIMILGYLQSTSAADPALVAKTQTVLDRGYKLLTGFETPEKGYEWFGKTPGHEALTAYGLMEFADMAKVYDVDRKMVERTADWLMSRRDQQGGFQRSATALDSFGRASPATTNAYIMWALAEAKRTTGMPKELATQKQLGADTKDPYLLALAANTNLLAAPKAPDTAAMVKRLVAMQGKDGSFTGAKETITMSGGESLAIETTALATLALIKASANSEYESQIRGAVEFLNGKRGGYGAWGNTQATILGLKALTAYSEHARQMAAGGSATLVVNGKDAGTIKFDKGRREALVWDRFADKLAPGKNTIEIRLDGGATLPYSVALDYRSVQPKSSPRTKVSLSTQLLKTQAKMGEGVTLRAHVENTTNAGIPMTLARIGLPGGTVFQTWQLKELRDKGLIDFYETRPREVILYWRALPPGAKKAIDLNLLAQVPGSFEAPASSAYLYYTAEDKAWTKAVAIAIDK